MTETKKPKTEAVKKREAKEELFCILYTTLNSPTYKNGQKSAEGAGWAKKSARVTASKLITKPNISERINGILKGHQSKLNLTAERVLTEISLLAFSDIGSFFDEDGYLKDWKKLTRNQTACLSSVDMELFKKPKDGEERIHISQAKSMKLWNKIKALEMLASHLSLLKTEPGAGDGEEMDESFL